MDEKNVLNSIYGVQADKQPKIKITVTIGWLDFIFDDAIQATFFMMTARKHISKDGRNYNITMAGTFIEDDTEEDIGDEE